MINLHETGWHDNGEISDWEHRYSAHMKNANVYAEASRWANGNYTQTTAAYLEDIDRDGVNEVVMHNDKLLAVYESIGGKANWIFVKNNNGGHYSVVGSDMAYWSETDGDYNESSNNHVAALSESYPNQQHDTYEWNLLQTSGEEVEVEFSKNNITKTCKLETGNAYLEVEYTTSGDIYVKSGWSPDLLDLIWSGKGNLQRMWGDYGNYCGRRNNASGATAAYVLGNGGAEHNTSFEGTLVMGDEIKGGANFKIFLYAGFTSEPYDEFNNKVIELDNLADILEDDIPPTVWQQQAAWVDENKLQLTFSEAISAATAENEANYQLQNFSGSYTITEAVLTHNRRVVLTSNNDFSTGDLGEIVLHNIADLNGNVIAADQNIVAVVEIIRPHLVGSFNDWQPDDHSYDLNLQANGLWQASLQLEAGEHGYKILETDNWDDNEFPYENQIISLDETTEVTFFVNCGAKIENFEGIEYVCHNTNLPVVVGDFLSEIGGTDWNEQTELTMMNDEGMNGDDVAGDGIFSRTVHIPQGSYEYKVVLNNNWDQNTTSENLSFNISQNADVTFFYNMIENNVDLSYEMVANEQQTELILPAAKITAVYPNPFISGSSKSSSAEVKFNLKKAQKIQLNAYNIKGQLVKKLAVGKFGTGEHTISWNMQRQEIATGIYFIKLQAGKNNDVRRILYLK
ncbi:MAG: T9SS type A sorting domain-containing protein [Candidatus Cloacimonadota bacterium]|nr:T9SS type A sorting domain-containing protein [Candidatus Cloacimonadota bacterium]